MLPTAIGPIWRKGSSASIQLRPPEMDKKRVSIPTLDTRSSAPPPGVAHIHCEPLVPSCDTSRVQDVCQVHGWAGVTHKDPM